MNIQYFNYIKIATQQVLRATSFQLRKNLMIYSDQSRITTQADKKKNFQEERRRNQEHKDLSWFTLLQGLCPVLCKLAKISTKQDHKISLQPFLPASYHCSPQYTLLPAALTLLNPSASVNQCRNLLYKHHLQPASKHCSPQHSHPTEPSSRCETSAEIYCTNSITNPVIENSKQITRKVRSIIDHSVLLHITDCKRLKTRCRGLSFGPKPKSQEPHSRMLQDSRSLRFLVLKSFVKGVCTNWALFLT